MMQVQKGQVKYGDRTDLIVDYGIVDDKQYYFLNGGNLSNGSYIATTKLIEAIPSKEVPMNLGVIDKEGNQVIPFDNKNIKSLFDEYLLAEISKPISESVIANIEARNNPLAISELVSTSSTIKASINQKMNPETGKFCFNDQFSEATIYDYSGTNILNNEYYSYIGCDDTGFYLSKNVLDSPVFKYDFETKSLINLSEEKVEEFVPEKLPEESPIDMVTSEEPVEGVKTEEVSSPEIPVVEATEVSDKVEVSNDNVQVDVPVKSTLDNSEEKYEASKADQIDVSDVNIDKEELEEKIVEEMKKDDNKEVVQESNNIESENVTTEEISEESNTETVPANEEVEDLQTVSNDVVNEELNIEDEVDGNKELNISNDSISDEDTFNIDMDMRDKFNSEFEQSLDDYSDAQYSVSRTPVDYDYNSDVTDYQYDSRETNTSILPDAISTMDSLIRQNRELKKELSAMDKKNSNLENKIINFETAVSKLENKNQVLENQNRQLDNEINDKSDVIEKQNRKIISLEERIKTHQKDEADLSNLLKTAQGVLRQGDSYNNYDNLERSYGRRVA